MARLTLRLDFGPGQAVGHGKIRLLEAVREFGSIAAAGRSMGMSYRRAWLLIDELNTLFAKPVIATKHGGQHGGGAELTPLALESSSNTTQSKPRRTPRRPPNSKRCRRQQ